MSERPLSERVRERGARWGVEYGIFLVDATVERDWQADVADEIAALEAKAALADELVADVNRLNRMVDDLGEERDRLRAALDERCVCEEGYRCDFCAVLEEGGDDE